MFTLTFETENGMFSNVPRDEITGMLRAIAARIDATGKPSGDILNGPEDKPIGSFRYDPFGD